MYNICFICTRLSPMCDNACTSFSFCSCVCLKAAFLSVDDDDLPSALSSCASDSIIKLRSRTLCLCFTRIHSYLILMLLLLLSAEMFQRLRRDPRACDRAIFFFIAEGPHVYVICVPKWFTNVVHPNKPTRTYRVATHALGDDNLGPKNILDRKIMRSELIIII